jgi:hypothetical protein
MNRSLTEQTQSISSETANDPEWPAGQVCESKLKALATLLEAAHDALDVHHDKWDYSVPLRVLQEGGVTESTLLWLYHKGYVEYRAGRGRGRRKRDSSTLRFASTTRAVLTASGIEFACAVFSSGGAPSMVSATGAPVAEDHSRALVLPIWSEERALLTFGGLVVKQFEKPAENQTAILREFQSQNWIPWIANPLAPDPYLDDRQRLADAVYQLNHHQKHKLLHFRRDGRRKGVLWEGLRKHV